MIRQTCAGVAMAAGLSLAACSPAEAEAPEAPAAAAAPAATAPASTFTPAELTAMVRDQGASEAVVALLDMPEDPRWMAVLAGVSSGDQAWLDTIPVMADGLDGEAAGSISMSLSDALAHNAEGVIRIAGPQGSLEEVCFPTPPSEVPAEEARNEALHSQKVAGVERINDPALAAWRDECLGWLRP